MSDPTNDSTVPAPAQPEQDVPPHGWMLFDGQAVVLQLKEPYIGVTYPADVMRNAEGKWQLTPVLRGILRVLPNGDGGLVLMLQIPEPSAGTLTFITVHPADVRYCTHIEKQGPPQQQIITP
jgi:hypothetical protein